MANEVTTAQEHIYSGHILNLRVDTVRLADGTPARREIIEHADAVTLAPLDDKGNVLFVRQFRKAVEQELYELPAGIMEEGESPEEAARRELAEETGLEAGTMVHLAGCYSSPGFCTEYMHLYRASDLRPMTGDAHTDADEDLTTAWIPIAGALRMIETGEIRDAKSIACLMLAIRE